MHRCIWLVFGVVLAISLTGCAQQETTETASEKAPAAQEKTASGYMLDGDFLIVLRAEQSREQCGTTAAIKPS